MPMQLTYTGKGYITSPPVLVRLLRHHPLQVVQHVTPPLVHNHSHRQVAEQVLRCQLDGSQVPAGDVYGCVVQVKGRGRGGAGETGRRRAASRVGGGVRMQPRP